MQRRLMRSEADRSEKCCSAKSGFSKELGAMMAIRFSKTTTKSRSIQAQGKKN